MGNLALNQRALIKWHFHSVPLSKNVYFDLNYSYCATECTAKTLSNFYVVKFLEEIHYTKSVTDLFVLTELPLHFCIMFQIKNIPPYFYVIELTAKNGPHQRWIESIKEGMSKVAKSNICQITTHKSYELKWRIR